MDEARHGLTFKPGGYKPRPRKSTRSGAADRGRPAPRHPAGRGAPESKASPPDEPGRKPKPKAKRTAGRIPAPPRNIAQKAQKPKRSFGGGRGTINARLDSNHAGQPNRRITGLAVLFSILIALLVGRLVQLQVVSPDRYVALGESQRVRTLELPAERGMILDRNGFELALSIPQETVWADPRLMADPEATARKLAAVVDTPFDTLRDRFTREEAAFVYVQRRVEPEVADSIRSLELDGVYFLDEPRRFAPAGDLALSILGQVGIDSEGLSGLESLYNSTLTGVAGELLVERDPQGNRIPAGRQKVVAPQRGSDLVLTLDRMLQYEAERLLSDQLEAMDAEGAVAIVTRPSTGEVLAMANMERDKETGEIKRSRVNKSLVNVYEPGSAAKIVTVAAAIEEGLVTADTVLEVPWRYRVADHTFTDHDAHPPELWTVADILRVSSNVGTIMLAEMLGPDRLHDYFEKFGVGSPTALGFPGESGGLLLPTSQWSGTSIGTIAIGQGISVTPMQMLGAFNVIANDGVYIDPRLVAAKVVDGKRSDIEQGARRRVISPETAKAMQQMMRQVVDSGTARQAAIEQYPVAGKTGTARKPNEGARGYEEGAYFATFGGFVPSNDPELSVIVVFDEPSASIFGGTVSAPVFADLARYSLRQLQIPPPLEMMRPAAPISDDDELVDMSAPPLVRSTPATTIVPEDGTAAESEPDSSASSDAD